MSKQPQDEAAFLAQLRATLDQSVESLDPATRTRLAAARRKAVAEMGKQRLPHKPIMLLAMAASVAVLAVGVSLWWPTATGTMPAMDDLSLLTAGEEFELLEDLEFYRWLEATEHTT
jgi:Protein of unknown function (DUF3619)